MSKIPLGRPRGQMSESMLTAAFIILSGGLQDAYTYLCRGKVFANAQTGNIVLFSAYLFDGDWAHSRRYLVPVLSFMLGIFVAECIHRHFKHMERVHWRQLILLAEIVLLFLVGFLPQEGSTESEGSAVSNLMIWLENNALWAGFVFIAACVGVLAIWQKHREE